MTGTYVFEGLLVAGVLTLWVIAWGAIRADRKQRAADLVIDQDWQRFVHREATKPEGSR